MTFEIALNIIPGQIYKRLPEDNFVDPGNVTRDPLALYPLWQMVFYFHDNIGDVVGVQVGVWGDSEEVAYISEYGYLGPYVIPTPTPTISPTPALTPSPESTPRTETFPATLVFVAAVGIALAAIGLLIYLKKRHRGRRI
jgi:hypothetical protein